MLRELHDFYSFSEFVSGAHGDCGPDASLIALHTVNPQRWPLTPGALGALNADELAKHDEDPGGAQNIPHMDHYLDTLGIKHDTFCSYANDLGGLPYQPYTLAKLHDELKNSAGVYPIIIETSTAGAGLPDDERGVQYHYFVIGGITDTGTTPDGFTGGYLRADGDSRTDSASGSPTAPILTSWTEIALTNPCGYLVIKQAPVAPAPPPPPPPVGHVTLIDGQTLAEVAAAHGIANWYESLYKPNMGAIEADAKAHGLHDSASGYYVFPGLTIALPAGVK